MHRSLYTAIILLAVIGGSYYLYQNKEEFAITYQTPAERDEYVRFGMEAFDSIKDNYWQEHGTYDLPTIYKLALEKVSGKPQALATTSREAVAEMLHREVLLATSTEAKKNLTLNTLIVVLYNLQPIGRNGILSEKQETELRQTVSNINPATNLYQNLGLEKGATVEEVEKAAKAKELELKNATSTEAIAVREQVAYAKKVLTDPNTKSLYDTNQVEPTIFTQRINGTLYMYISKIAPTTFFEFAKAVDNASTTPGLDSLILDMRGNMGGALDFAQNFIGLFMGQNQYAFDLFRQGKYEVQRTVQPKYPELDRYKDIAIITDNMSQSTAEVISAAFKRLNLGSTVGVNTRGWGTVENTFPLTTVIDPSTKYTLLLVHSITLRDDNQPIEGRGVDPDINTGKKGWQNDLTQQFNSRSLIDALKKVASTPPLK